MKVAKIIGIVFMWVAAAIVQAQDAEQSYRDARRTLNSQDFDAAVNAFRALRRDYPESPYVGDAYYWEAFALERGGNLQRAVEVIDELLREQPEASTLDDARAMRIRICSELARRGDGQCAEEVAETVRDPSGLDDATRMAAVNALLNMRADRAVPIATQVVANRSQPRNVRRQALVVLADKAEGDAQLEAQARETLRSVALDETDDLEVRRQAVFWLSELPGEATLATLSELVNGAGDRELRERAVFAIAQHESPEAMSLLEGLAGNEALDLELRNRAIFWIGDEGEEQALPFLTRLYEQLTNEELKRQVLFAVSETDADGAAEWLLSRAEDEGASVELRKQALFWAAESGVSATALGSMYARFEDPELRGQLIWLIADQGGEGSLESLLDIARNDPDPEMRRTAVFWIGDSDDPRAAEFLLELLEQ